MARPWSALVIVYTEIDARVRRRPVRRRISSDEYDANRVAVDAMPAAVASWSEGNASLEPFDVVDAPGPLHSITDIGGGRFWAGPRDCAGELRGGYDSVVVLWPTDGTLELCGWGCTIGPSSDALGAGFSSCISDHWQGYRDRLHPEEGFVHEWLHQVESVFRSSGFGPDVFPDLHDAGHSRSYRSTDLSPFGRTYGEHEAQTGTWQPWYRDWMTGTVRRPDGDGCYGISGEVWACR